MSKSLAVPVTPALRAAIADIVTEAMTQALPGIMAEVLTAVQGGALAQTVAQPKAGAKAKRSTKARTKSEPKVQRFVHTGSLFEATLGGCPKGTCVALRANGANYRVGQLTAEGVELIHPDGRVFHYPASRVVFEVA